MLGEKWQYVEVEVKLHDCILEDIFSHTVSRIAQFFPLWRCRVLAQDISSCFLIGEPSCVSDERLI